MTEVLREYLTRNILTSISGKKTTMMSVRNFYNAMTPGSSISLNFGKGRSSYFALHKEDVGAEWVMNQNQLPREGSLLNKLNQKGLLTFLDFHFLFLIMSTPRRYVDMVFHAFDVSADGYVELKVCIIVYGIIIFIFLIS